MTGAFLAAAGVTFAGWCLERNLQNAMFSVFALSYALAVLLWRAFVPSFF